MEEGKAEARQEWVGDGGNIEIGVNDVQLSDAQIRQLVERMKALESSNARLRRRIEGTSKDEARVLAQNEQLVRQISRLQEDLDRQQARQRKKEPLRQRLAGPVVTFPTRTGSKWPEPLKERVRPFAGLGQEPGAAIDALRRILPQIFESAQDAWDWIDKKLEACITLPELRQAIRNLKIKNLDPEHVFHDLQTPAHDVLRFPKFIESFEWRGPHPGRVMNHSQFSMGSHGSTFSTHSGKPPHIASKVKEVLAAHPDGWDASSLMGEFRATVEKKRETPFYDPATLLDIIEPKDVRLMSAREKFMVRSMQLPEGVKFEASSDGDKTWTERLAMGWIGRMEEDEALVALRKEHERAVARQHSLEQNKPGNLSEPFKLDLSGLESLPHGLGKEVTFSAPRRKISAIKPAHKLKDGFAFSQDGDQVRRLFREHRDIVASRRPKVSSVTSDHAWLKQSILLAGMQKKQEREAREKDHYDLDGRCYPRQPLSPKNGIGIAEEPVGGGTEQLDASLDAAMQSGDRAQLAAIIRRRREEAHSSKSCSKRDPFDNASAANIAYMQVQKLAHQQLTSGTLISPRHDPSLKKALTQVASEYPRLGTTASTIQNRPLDAAADTPSGSSMVDALPSTASEPIGAALSLERPPRANLKPMSRQEIKALAMTPDRPRLLRINTGLLDKHAMMQ